MVVWKKWSAWMLGFAFLLFWWLTGADLRFLLLAVTVLCLYFLARFLFRSRRLRLNIQENDATVSMHTPSQASDSVSEAWRNGLQSLKAQPFRYQKRQELCQPWFLVLDETEETSSLFDPLGENLGSVSSPLVWHFLSSLVLLRLPSARFDDALWQKLLRLLGHNREGVPLRGIVVLIDADTWRKKNAADRCAMSQRISLSVQNILQVLNRRCQVTVLVEGLENIEGFDEVLARMEDLDVPLGASFPKSLSPGDLAERAALGAVRSLENAVQQCAEKGQIPQGRMLMALQELRGFGAILAPLAEELSGHAHLPFTLQGIYFCRNGGEGGRPAFLSTLFSQILPSFPHTLPLNEHLPQRASFRAFSCALWLILLLLVCGLMGLNVLHGQSVLQKVQKSEQTLEGSDLQKIAGKLKILENVIAKKNAWPIPSMGLDMTEKIVRRLQKECLEDVSSKVIQPLFAEYRASLESYGEKNGPALLKTYQGLLWFARMLSKSHPGNPSFSLPFQTGLLSQTEEDTLRGEILGSSFDLLANESARGILTRDLRTLLLNALSHEDPSMLEALLLVLKEEVRAENISATRFWPSAPRISVSKVYTAEAHSVFEELLKSLGSLDEGNRLGPLLRALKKNYGKRSYAAWRSFLEEAAGFGASVREHEVAANLSAVSSVKEFPELALLEVFFTETADLGKFHPNPLWMQRSLEIGRRVKTVQSREENGLEESDGLFWRLLLTNPALLLELWNEEKSMQGVSDVLEQSGLLLDYFKKIIPLLELGREKESALQACRLLYGGKKSTQEERDYAGEFARAHESLSMLQKALGSRADCPAFKILSGILDGLEEWMTVQGAFALETGWQKNVTGANLSAEQARAYAMQHAAEFFVRKEDGFAPASWKNHVFPLTRDFLAFLGKKGIDKEGSLEGTFFVELDAAPARANEGAMEDIQERRLECICSNERINLFEGNTTEEQSFQYTAASCNQVSLTLKFPSFVCRREYTDFAEFFRKFETGEAILGKENCLLDSLKLQKIGLQAIRVRILPDNVRSVLYPKGDPLPRRLTKVW